MNDHSRSEGDATGHLLVFSFHFGDHGPTGGFRWTRMLDHLAESGWTADVITATAPNVDASTTGPIRVHHVPAVTWPERAGEWLLARAASVVRLLRGGGRSVEDSAESAPPEPTAPTPEQIEYLRGRADGLSVWKPGDRLPLKMRLLRSYVTTIDLLQEYLWSRKAAAAGISATRRTAPSAVISSGPPHVAHLAAVKASKRSGSPLVLDYRDPWVIGADELATYLPRVFQWVGRRLEPKVQEAASVIVLNTDEARRRSAERVPPLPERTRVAIPNGYDARPEAGITPDFDVFRIVFGGWLHPYMDIRPVFRAAGRLREEAGLDPDRFQFQLLGTGPHFGGMSFDEHAVAYGLHGCLTVFDRMPREEARARQQQASVLLAFDYPYPLAVVMKAYDYLPMPGRLLLVGQPGSALDQVGSAVGAPVVPPGDDEAMYQRLRTALDDWEKRRSPGPHDTTLAFHRSRRNEEAERLLNELVSTPSTVVGSR